MQNITLAYDILTARPIQVLKKMLLWFPLKRLNNLLCSFFNASQVLCENALSVRASLLCFLAVSKKNKDKSKKQHQLSRGRKINNNRTNENNALSHSSNQNAFNSFL